MSALAPTLEAFFSQRLIAQRDASPRTVAAYRDTWRLLLGFTSEQTGKQPCQLDIADFDAPLIGAFLDHLEAERGNSPRTRNARLAAIHSFYRFASLRHPEHAQTIARVIEDPAEAPQPPADLLPRRTRDQGVARGAGPHQLGLAGAITRCCWWRSKPACASPSSPRCATATSASAPALMPGSRGKGRKERCAMFTSETVAVLRVWCRERKGEPDDPLFPTRRGGPLTAKAVAWLIDKHTTIAAAACPSLASKRVTPHVLRHTTAMLCEPRTSTSTRSRCGWVMRAPSPPSPTCTPTTSSSSEPSNASPPPARGPADTDPPTESWPSWKGCDYPQ